MLQIPEHFGDVAGNVCLLRHVGNGNDTTVGLDSQLGLAGALVIGQAQFGSGGQMMVGHYFQAGRCRLESGQGGHGVQNLGGVFYAHVVQINDNVILPQFIQIMPVNVSRPLGDIFVDLIQIGHGLVLG